MPDEYVAILITPDTIRDELTEQVLKDLFTAVPMQILWQKEWRIVSEDMVLSIYPRIVGRPSCAPVIKTMMAGPCLVVLARGENPYLKLREVKGRIKFNESFTQVEITGLRLKYRTWSPKELDQLKEGNSNDRQAILNRIYEYRMHTTDNLDETANICSLCMNSVEVEALRILAPTLYNEVIRLKSKTKEKAIREG